MRVDKKFLTIDEQIELLKARGLNVTDICEARKALENLNYYRLSGYSLTLRKDDKFYENIDFQDLMQIYNFDNELKTMLFNVLTEIEINLKTHIAYILGQQTGSMGYMLPTNYANQSHYRQFVTGFEKALKDNKHEAFVKHHNEEYNGEYPIWVAVEVLSFGNTSKLFSALNYSIKETIGEEYYNGISPKYLETWFHSMAVLRNICAHGVRLFNRGLPTAVAFTRKELDELKAYGYNPNSIGKRLFFAIIIIHRILYDKTLRDELIKQIKMLMQKYPFVKIEHYGFKDNWEEILIALNAKYS